MLKYITVGEINQAAKNPAEFIRACELKYSRMIEDAAKNILESSSHKPIILLSGPSGSGKTTTAMRIEALLDSWGHDTHTISLDNYYYRDENLELPTDDEGQIDLESPLIIDNVLLRRHMEMLIEGKTVNVPHFDFVNQRRSERFTPVTRNNGEIIVIEGIHALNPDVVGDAHSWGTGVYVSVRTRLRDENGFVLHPSKVRLLRRLMRDQRGRGQTYIDTISRLRSVNRGERMYIMPNKIHADISLDTFCPYELGVYRDILLPGLLSVDPEFMEDSDVSDLAPMLRQLETMPMDGIPREALVREFIGGGLV